MPGHNANNAKRCSKRGRGALTVSRAEAEFARHLKALGLADETAYRAWCRDNGFGTGLQKTWQERRDERLARCKRADQESADAAFREHLRALGLADAVAYASWCRERNFGASHQKTAPQRRQEEEAARRERAQAAMVTSRRQDRRPEELLRCLHRGEALPGAPMSPVLRQVRDAFALPGNHSRTGDAFLRLLLHAQKCSRLLAVEPVIPALGEQTGNTFVDALLALARHERDWLRPPEDWQPDTKSSHRQFAALARHLLARYPIPPFMDTAWFRGDAPAAREQQGWFKHVGGGQNIRTAAGLPVTLTKRAAHLFPKAPREYTVEAALRWAQIRALGGGEDLVRAVVATRLGERFEDEAFWVSVLHFFVNNPQLDRAWVGPIVDYIAFRREAPREAEGPAGAEPHGPPPYPNFSMKGRTAVALTRLVEEWHRELAREQAKPPVAWEPSGIRGFLSDDPEGEPVRWTITELLSARELADEGREMRHCVASYARSCARGQQSIWSLQMHAPDGRPPRRVMTIAVNNARHMITQARGRCNHLPGDRRASARLDDAPDLMKRWAAQERLGIASHL